ncbi:MAG TPA: hypothetical protein VFA15_01360, partial [Nitrososphaera sp.]|nr:hypothetical protein [Nitrososphaera sp.]
DTMLGRLGTGHQSGMSGAGFGIGVVVMSVAVNRSPIHEITKTPRAETALKSAWLIASQLIDCYLQNQADGLIDSAQTAVFDRDRTIARFQFFAGCATVCGANGKQAKECDRDSPESRVFHQFRI